jgi:hypothetical protein
MGYYLREHSEDILQCSIIQSFALLEGDFLGTAENTKHFCMAKIVLTVLDTGRSQRTMVMV